ncbi:hypothetical protein GPALN_007791 [Globodera pallida]|nr:hypothetical protein GPALN_002075 [Globodera pallida]KAI3418683.1 hypothetical protein GPALN_007791 [Globodera pallida]
MAVALISDRSHALEDFGRNCKSQQEELQSRIKQLEREKHNSMAVALIRDRSHALEDFGRNCKSQQEELQSSWSGRSTTGIANANKKKYKAVGAGEAQQHGFCADRCPNRCVGGLCKELQMPTRRTTKQLEREKHNSMAFALIGARTDALEDFQLEREKHNSMAFALIGARTDALEDFHGFCADRCPNRCVGGLCKELQMPTRRSTKQLEREKHNSMAFALIGARTDALEDFVRNCKCQQEELQSRIKQLEREKHNRWEGMEQRLPSQF